MKNQENKRNSKEAILKRSTPDFRHGRHCVFKMHVHLVFVTKYRKTLFRDEVLKHMEAVFENVCIDFEAELTQFNGEENHVHLLIEYPPKVSVSKLVNSLKGVSSRHIRKEFKAYLKQGPLWSRSYFASSCGGAPLEIVRTYIEQQNRPD